MVVCCLEPYNISYAKSEMPVNKDELSACGVIRLRSPTDTHGQP